MQKMTIKEARKILGEDAEALTDGELVKLLNKFRIFAEACYNKLYKDSVTRIDQVK